MQLDYSAPLWTISGQDLPGLDYSVTDPQFPQQWTYKLGATLVALITMCADNLRLDTDFQMEPVKIAHLLGLSRRRLSHVIDRGVEFDFITITSRTSFTVVLDAKERDPMNEAAWARSRKRWHAPVEVSA